MEGHHSPALAIWIPINGAGEEGADVCVCGCGWLLQHKGQLRVRSPERRRNISYATVAHGNDVCPP